MSLLYSIKRQDARRRAPLGVFSTFAVGNVRPLALRGTQGGPPDPGSVRLRPRSPTGGAGPEGERAPYTHTHTWTVVYTGPEVIHEDAIAIASPIATEPR